MFVTCTSTHKNDKPVSGAGKGRRACNYTSRIWIPPSIPLWLPVDWAVRFPPISAKWKWAWMLTNIEKHVPGIMTSLLMSSPPISIFPPWLFRYRYSNSRDVVSRSPSFSHPASRVLWRACSQAKNARYTYWFPYFDVLKNGWRSPAVRHLPAVNVKQTIERRSVYFWITTKYNSQRKNKRN